MAVVKINPVVTIEGANSISGMGNRSPKTSTSQPPTKPTTLRTQASMRSEREKKKIGHRRVDAAGQVSYKKVSGKTIVLFVVTTTFKSLGAYY